MRLSQARILEYGGATPGARGATARYGERRGLLLRLTTADGLVGQGEASPLPGYSPDTLDEARSALAALDVGQVPDVAATPDGCAALLDWSGGTRFTASPSARFAVETALLDVLGQRARLPLWALLSGEVARRIPLCSLLGGADDAGLLDRARAAALRGAHTVKVKIAGPDLGTQVDSLHQVRAIVGDTCRLRLDANRSLEGSTASAELSRLGLLAPELVEEPVPLRSLALLGPGTVPTALDESLQDPDVWEHADPHLRRVQCVAVILKPMTLGGLGGCRRLARAASDRDLAVTISHLFDGPVALAAAAHLAIALASTDLGSGLDRHAGLEAWPAMALPFLGEAALLTPSAPGLGLPPLSDP